MSIIIASLLHNPQSGLWYAQIYFLNITEMVPYLIWVPDFFGPQEIWSSHENHFTTFLCREKLPGAQSSRGPKKPGSQMWSGTISVIAYFLSRAKSEHFCSTTLNSVHPKCKFNKKSFNVFLTSNYSPNSTINF